MRGSSIIFIIDMCFGTAKYIFSWLIIILWHREKTKTVRKLSVCKFHISYFDSTLIITRRDRTQGRDLEIGVVFNITDMYLLIMLKGCALHYIANQGHINFGPKIKHELYYSIYCKMPKLTTNLPFLIVVVV